MAVIAYVRVSSNKQTVEHQRFELKRFARQNQIQIDFWEEEVITSRQPLQKRKLGAVLETLSAGDILLACEISRLGRSLLEVMRILETCLNKDCQVWTIKESYRLGNDIQSKVMAFAFGLAAEIERNLISARTKASLANLKASGKKLGRPQQATSQNLMLSQNRKQIKLLWERGMPKTQIARQMGVHRNTMSRFIAQMKWQKQPRVRAVKKI